MTAPTKHCPRCKTDKPHDQFSKRSASKDGLQPTCRACKALGHPVYHRARVLRRRAAMRAA